MKGRARMKFDRRYFYFQLKLKQAKVDLAFHKIIQINYSYTKRSLTVIKSDFYPVKTYGIGAINSSIPPFLGCKQRIFQSHVPPIR